MSVKIGDPCPAADCKGKIVKFKGTIPDDSFETYDSPARKRDMKVWRCSEEHDQYE